MRSLSRLSTPFRSLSSEYRQTSNPSAVGVEIHALGRVMNVSHAWLRHNCPCPLCAQRVGTSLGWQSLQDPCEVLEGSDIFESEIGGKSFSYKWKDSRGRVHDGVLSLKWIEENLSPFTVKDPTPYVTRKVLEKKDIDKKNVNITGATTSVRGVEYVGPDFSWDDILASDRALYKWLKAINEDGMAIVNEAPRDPHTLDKLATRVGRVQETIYGYYQDVKASRNPTNVAFSSACLQLHQDVAYYESMPGLQMLHCLHQDESLEGGESTFMDGIQIAHVLKEQFPEDFDVLTRTNASFLSSVVPSPTSVSAGVDPYTYRMRYERPHIRVNSNNDIVSLAWSPNFEAPFIGDAQEMERYFKARHRFAWLVREMESEAQIWTKLKPGQVVVFNNRRMFHGRKEFFMKSTDTTDQSKVTGCRDDPARHLQLVYVNIDDYWNRLNQLSAIFGDPADLKRIYNGDEVRSLKVD